jgi:hypothetical protein
MVHHRGFRLPHLLLPRAGIDLRRWAVIACDQHTSEAEYWRQVARQVGEAPSTLALIYPEVWLDAPDGAERIGRIQQAMRDCLAQGWLDEHDGAVYVERHLEGGRVRRGLLMEIDLEHYDYGSTSCSLIRPTEGTIVARLAPRIAVRRDAELELPHILVLIDDPQGSVIEPLAAQRNALPPLYDTELMLGGGRVSGHAVDVERAERALDALAALAAPATFAVRYGVPADTPPMLFAVGDGNHSLATAKSIWEEHKATLGPGHPSRWALVEVVNIHDPALDFAPIHRLLFDVRCDLRLRLAQAFGGRMTCTEVASAAAMRERLRQAPADCHAAGLIGPAARFSVLEIEQPTAALAVASFQSFLDDCVARGDIGSVDYIHGDEVLERQASAAGCVGLHLAPLGKDELLRRVVQQGPLPRKTFSMGEAHEKRYYIEARRIKVPLAAAH